MCVLSLNFALSSCTFTPNRCACVCVLYIAINWCKTATTSFAHTAAEVPGAPHKFQPNNYLQCRVTLSGVRTRWQNGTFTLSMLMNLVFSNLLPKQYLKKKSQFIHNKYFYLTVCIAHYSLYPGPLSHWATKPLHPFQLSRVQDALVVTCLQAFFFFIKPRAKFLLWICLCHQATVWQTLTLWKWKC